MQPQILKVNDIEKSIKEVGIEYYVDRLLQDERGDYFYVECEKHCDHEAKLLSPADADNGWKLIEMISRGEPGDTDFTMYFKIRIHPVPKDVAWFCIDAIRLKSLVMGLGSGQYEGTGPHGGVIKWYLPKDGDFDELPAEAIQVETL